MSRKLNFWIESKGIYPIDKKYTVNNPVDLENLHVKSTIAVHSISNNHQTDDKNTKKYSKYKERWVAEAF